MKMQQRRSHNKSRAGCQNCKKRHVKCDEQGPPCANCAVRGSTDTCDYGNNLRAPIQEVISSSSRESSVSTLPEITFTIRSRQLLELELMHRWSVCTYKSFCGVADDYHYLQVILPQYALQYGFLLHGILAVSALDIATTDLHREDARSAEYVQMAMEYYDKASTSFRQQLENITQNNIHCIYMFSVFALCINLAMTQYTGLSFDKHYSLLDHIPVFFDLGLASTSFYLKYPDWMQNSPFSKSLSTATRLISEPSPQLDITTEDAIKRLKSIIEHDSAVLIASEQELYRKALKGLSLCYVEDKKNLVAGFCIAFPTLVGKEFATEVGNMKPVALLILMHWAVLLHDYGCVTWWAKSVGYNLVKEICDTLPVLQPNLLESPDWRDGIDWARQCVGLSLLEDDCIDSHYS